MSDNSHPTKQAILFVARPRRTDAPTVTERLVEHGWSVMVYDGHCRLCAASVRFLAARSRGRLLAFCALQSPAGRNAVRVRGVANTGADSTVVLTPCAVLRGSDAVLHLLTFMPAPWPRVVWALHRVPRALRETLYVCIDAGRRRWLQRRAECMLSIAAQARRFVR